MTIFVLHRDRTLRSRVRGLPRGRGAHGLDDWHRLLAELPASSEGTVAIVDPFTAGGRIAPQLALLRREFPSTVVVAAAAAEALTPACIVALGELGVAEVVRLGVDSTPARLQAILERARERAALALVLAALPPGLPPRTRTLVEAALATVIGGGGPADLARSLFVSPRTLQRRCARAGLPAPRSLLALLRTVMAARFLDDPARTVLSAALAAGYGSDTSLHRAFRRLGLPSPARLRRGPALHGAMDAFLGRLRPQRP